MLAVSSNIPGWNKRIWFIIFGMEEKIQLKMNDFQEVIALDENF